MYATYFVFLVSGSNFPKEMLNERIAGEGAGALLNTYRPRPESNVGQEDLAAPRALGRIRKDGLESSTP